MSMDINLMGLGMPAALAARIASGGTGPIFLTAAGTSPSTATQIRGKQFVTFINAGAGGVQLPAVGGSDNAAEIADDFVVHNGTASPVTVYAASGATLNVGGHNYTGTTGFTLATLTTLTFYPVSATQGFGLSN